MARRWFHEHFRPRDAYIGLTTLLLAALGLAVWTLGAADDGTLREHALTAIVTVISTLGGYYLGNRESERAVERAEVESHRAARLLDELAKARSIVGRLESELTETADTAVGLAKGPEMPGRE